MGEGVFSLLKTIMEDKHNLQYQQQEGSSKPRPPASGPVSSITEMLQNAMLKSQGTNSSAPREEDAAGNTQSREAVAIPLSSQATLMTPSQLTSGKSSEFHFESMDSQGSFYPNSRRTQSAMHTAKVSSHILHLSLPLLRSRKGARNAITKREPPGLCFLDQTELARNEPGVISAIPE